MTTLWKHQQAAFDFACPKPASLCGMGCGCGKSATATALSDRWRTRRTLILCPSSVRNVWRRELHRHSQREAEACILDGGSVKQRTARAHYVVNSAVPVAYVVANYEAAWREPFRSWALAQSWDLVICDESHRVMRDSKIALFCNELRNHAERRLCLSGTPLTQDPVSVFAQCRFLNPSVFGTDLKTFTTRYENKRAIEMRKAFLKFNELWMIPTSIRPNPKPVAAPAWAVTGTLNTAEYLERLSSIAFRVESDVLDLPPLIMDRRTFQLGPVARVCHDAAQGGSSDQIASGRWNDLHRSFQVVMALQQITSGWLKGPNKTLEMDTGKADCLRDILVGAGGEPVVVFTRFVLDLDIVQGLAEELGLVYGEVSGRRKDGLTNTATMQDDVQVLGVQVQSGGEGIDLSRSRLVVFYSLSWSRKDRDQALSRVYRPPQRKSVIVYELVAENSIDEELYRALQARSEIIRDVWEAMPEPCASPRAQTCAL